jgi:hypothetical protein
MVKFSLSVSKNQRYQRYQPLRVSDPIIKLAQILDAPLGKKRIYIEDPIYGFNY